MLIRNRAVKMALRKEGTENSKRLLAVMDEPMNYVLEGRECFYILGKYSESEYSYLKMFVKRIFKSIVK